MEKNNVKCCKMNKHKNIFKFLKINFPNPLIRFFASKLFLLSEPGFG